MGQKLMEFYKKSEELGQMKARMRMAVLTLIPSAKAAAAPDSPQNIQLFTKALKEIEKEFKK